MELIKRIVNDIHPSIELEVDYPSRHVNGKLPTLDLKVWIECREKELSGESRVVSTILYEFYAKEVASKAVVSARSALSESVKKTILTQEVLRVLLKRSPQLPWSCEVKKVEEMAVRMQCSGYNKTFRYQVVSSALMAYKVRQEVEKNGKNQCTARKRGRERIERKKEA